MKKSFGLSAFLAIAVMLLVGGGMVSAQTSGVVVLKFPYYQVPPAIGSEWRQATLDGFNKEFAGKYRIDLEAIPSDQQYQQKMEVLATADQLPPLFEIKQVGMGDTLAKEGKLEDLKPYLDADPAWKAQFIPSSVAFNTKDGKIVSLPLYTDSFFGVFYNKELFAKAGIAEFPTTWDAMIAACEKLKAKGIPAFAFMTGENTWTTGLLFSALIASTPEGAAWLNNKVAHPDFENSKAFVAAAAKLQQLFKYAAPSSLGATYAVAQNTFVNGKAAMIANGPWMLGAFKDEKVSPAHFIDKVGTALYPGNIGVCGGGLGYSFAIPKNASKGEKDAAAAYLKYSTTGERAVGFMVMSGQSSAVIPIPAAVLKSLDALAIDNMNFGSKVKVSAISFGNVWPDSVVNVALAKELPLLASGKIKAQEFAHRLTVAAKN